MNIAFLTPEYPHEKTSHAAGIGTSVHNLASELVKNKHQVIIFVYAQDRDEEFKDNRINIVKIAYKKYTFLGWFLYRKYIEKVINKHILKFKIELLEAPDWTGITAFMKLKCPIVIRLHGSDTYFCHLENRKQKLKNYWFEKLALKNAKSIISVSKFTSIKTKELFNIRRDIKVIHNGIDLEKFRNSEENLNEINSILYFGSIIRKKGVLELASIFNRVIKSCPKVTLTLIGKNVVDILENKSTKELFINKLTKEAKINISFIDEVPYTEIQKHISKSSVVVLPSFAEAFPMTWLEAMAMKKALVTSNIGWATELMIDGQTGYTENPKNHELYAEKIIKLLVDKKLNTTMAKNARQHIITNFSQKIISNQNIKYFETIINESV